MKTNQSAETRHNVIKMPFSCCAHTRLKANARIDQLFSQNRRLWVELVLTRVVFGLVTGLAVGAVIASQWRV